MLLAFRCSQVADKSTSKRVTRNIRKAPATAKDTSVGMDRKRRLKEVDGLLLSCGCDMGLMKQYMA